MLFEGSIQNGLFHVLPCTDAGAEARNDTIMKQNIADYHTECIRTERMQSFSQVQKNEVPILKYITLKNKELVNKIGGLMIQVYNDAKQLSWSCQMD